VLTTSCGGKEHDFGTWNMNGQMPTEWPVNIASAIVGYEVVCVIVYASTDYSSAEIGDYMDTITNDKDYDFPYMYTNPGEAGFNFWSGQPNTYNLKVLVNHYPNISSNMTYLGKLQVIITHVN
jgi:hypothetical protein